MPPAKKPRKRSEKQMNAQLAKQATVMAQQQASPSVKVLAGTPSSASNFGPASQSTPPKTTVVGGSNVSITLTGLNESAQTSKPKQRQSGEATRLTIAGQPQYT